MRDFLTRAAIFTFGMFLVVLVLAVLFDHNLVIGSVLSLAFGVTLAWLTRVDTAQIFETVYDNDGIEVIAVNEQDPQVDPLDLHGDGTIRPGDPLYDVLMQVVDTGVTVFATLKKDGSWEIATEDFTPEEDWERLVEYWGD